jgi:hypothetical protein
MRRMAILFFFFLMGFAFLNSACRTKAIPQIQTKVQEATSPQILFEMSKSMCYGHCPVYEISIYQDGTCKYLGKANVEKIGNYKRKLSKEETDGLIHAFEENKFMEMKDEYTAHVSDLPTTRISFSRGGKIKKITDLIGAPKELKVLEKMLENIAFEDMGWEKEK